MLKKQIITFLLCSFISSSGLIAAEKKDAPGFRLESMKGKSVQMSDLNAGGSVVILSFFDTKCEPCIKELPSFEKLYKKYLKDSKVKIRMISLDESEEALKKFIKKYKVSIPVLKDPGGWKAGINYGVVKSGRAEIPQIFVIGKSGKIQYHYQGYKEHIGSILSKNIEVLKKEKVVKKGSKSINIVYTNSANGYLESCDCPENPFGGLVRRATAIKRIKAKHDNVLLVDTGDNFPVRENRLQADYVWKMMKLMDYDAVTYGDQELLFGAKLLDKQKEELNFVSSNVSVCDEEKCWDIAAPYIIKEFNGVKVAVFAVFSPDVFLFYPEDKLKNFKIENHIETIKTLVKALKKRADILILLSHSGDDDDKKIAAQFDDIDVIVGGHSQTLHKDPFKVNNTLIVQAGKNGHRVGRLTLEFDGNKKIKSAVNDIELLIKDIPDDPAALKLLKEYKIKTKNEAQKLLIK